MVRNLNEQLKIIEILFNKQIITEAELSYIFLHQAFLNVDFVTLLIQEDILGNDELINIVANYYQIPVFNINPEYKILTTDQNSFKFIQEGFFLYEDNSNNTQNIAVNNLMILPNLSDIGSFDSIYFIKRKDFYQFISDKLPIRVLDYATNHFRINHSKCYG